MTLAIMIPVALTLLIALVIFYAGDPKGGGSGLGDRADATEPQELRGPTQWENRDRSSDSSASGASGPS